MAQIDSNPRPLEAGLLAEQMEIPKAPHKLSEEKVYFVLYGISAMSYSKTKLGDEVCGRGSGTVFNRVTKSGLTVKVACA